MRKFFTIITRESPKYSEIGNDTNIKYTEYKNIPPILAIPISKGLCSYRDIYSKELSLEDFYNMYEIISVDIDNEKKLQKYMESQR